MRHALSMLLLLSTGCASLQLATDEPLPSTPARASESDGRRDQLRISRVLQVDYQGDYSHRFIRLLAEEPGVVRLDGVSDRTAWPSVRVWYRVPNGVQALHLVALASPHSPVLDLACHQDFRTIQAEFEGRPVDVRGVTLPDRRCALEIRLGGAPYGSFESEDPPPSPRPSPSPF